MSASDLPVGFSPDINPRSDGSIEIEANVDRIITLDDLLTAARADLKRFKVDSWSPNAWETHFKLGSAEDQYIERRTNYQVKARLIPNVEYLTLEAMAKEFRSLVLAHSPTKYKEIKRASFSGPGFLFMPDLFDLLTPFR